jgi:hypothetical protein
MFTMFVRAFELLRKVAAVVRTVQTIRGAFKGSPKATVIDLERKPLSADAATFKAEAGYEERAKLRAEVRTYEGRTGDVHPQHNKAFGIS